MVKNVLQEIGGIGIYALISLLLFFVVFTGALLWAAVQRASLCAKMSSLPLEPDSAATAEPKDSNHE